jgi:3-oxoacyl-[acyl-carrier-protein] synthase III
MNLEESKVDEYRKYGNTTSATLPLVLMILKHTKKGDTLFLLLWRRIHMVCLFKMGIRQK